MPTHICRFKVLSVESPALTSDQYIIHYIRGDTNRSSPSFHAYNGRVDFSKMPEGAAVLHFKSNKMAIANRANNFYAPKYIDFRLDAYSSQGYRRTVGETRVDCSQVLKDPSSGKGIMTAHFTIGASSRATIKVAILVYLRDMLPLSFDGLIEDSKSPESSATRPSAGGASGSNETVKTMLREEATTLLISLEALQDRRNRDGKTEAGTFPELEAEIQELEEKRRRLVGAEGLASQVVQARCHDCVEAQFYLLRHQHRAHYISVTAAFLRQLALKHKFNPDQLEVAHELSPAEKENIEKEIQKANDRITLLKRTQDEKREIIDRLQRSDNIEECFQRLLDCANEVESMENQIKLVEKTKAALVGKTTNKAVPKVSVPPPPVQDELTEINSRISTLKESMPGLRKKINHMKSTAISHILAWGRAKNAEGGQLAQGTTNVDELFDKPVETVPPQLPSQDLHHEEPVSAAKVERPQTSAPSRSTSSSSSSSSSSSGEDDDDDEPPPPGLGPQMFDSGLPRGRISDPSFIPSFQTDFGDHRKNFFSSNRSTPKKKEMEEPANRIPSFDDYMKRQKASNPHYDPMDDFSPSTTWGLPNKSSDTLNVAVGNQGNSFFSKHNSRSNSTSASDTGYGTYEANNPPMRYSFGSPEKENENMYIDSVPKYRFD